MDTNTALRIASDHKWSLELRLAEIYLALLPLQNSVDEKDQQMFNRAFVIIRYLAASQCARSPEHVIEQPRENYAPRTPQSIECLSHVLAFLWNQLTHSTSANAADSACLSELNSLLSEALERRHPELWARMRTGDLRAYNDPERFESHPNGPFGDTPWYRNLLSPRRWFRSFSRSWS